MRTLAAVTVVSLLVLTSILPMNPGSATPPGPEIGKYKRLALTHDLTESHLSWDAENLTISGPALTSVLTVNKAFLESEIGAWGSTSAFTPANGAVKFSGAEARVAPLRIGDEPLFTWGHPAMIHLEARPMWLEITQAEFGAPITLSLEDGNTDGQNISISREWLHSRGIHRPDAVHEDGTALDVTEDSDGFLVEMHHFSYLVLTAASIDVRGRLNGLVLPHDGEIRWFSAQKRLEIDVPDHTTAYDLMIEKGWIDLNVPFAKAQGFDWSSESLLIGVGRFRQFYVVSVSASFSPTIIMAHPHPLVLDVPEAFAEDPAQELKFISLASLSLSLASGFLPLTLLGEPMLLSAREAFYEVSWEDVGTGENGTFLMERYVLTNTESQYELHGEALVGVETVSLGFVFNSTTRRAALVGLNTTETAWQGPFELRGVHFFDRSNFTLNLTHEHPPSNVTPPEPGFSNGWPLGQQMRVSYVFDKEAWLHWLGQSDGTVAGFCHSVGNLFLANTIPYTLIGVPLVFTKCIVDRFENFLISPAPGCGPNSQYVCGDALLDAYSSAYKTHYLGGSPAYDHDLVTFLTGFRLRTTTGEFYGVAYGGPDGINDANVQTRYSLTNTNRASYWQEASTALRTYAMRIVILHEIGHTLRADHTTWVVQCAGWGGGWEPQSGKEIMGYGDLPFTQHHCYRFSDETDGTEALVMNSANRIQVGSLFYTIRPERWW